MLNRLTASLDFQGCGADAALGRQRLLASNIANADTPGYVARDMDFASALRGPRPGLVCGRDAGHLQRQPHRGAPARATCPACCMPASQTNLDRNSVDWTTERAAFADNSVKLRGHAALHQRQRAQPARRHQGPVRRRLMSMFSIFNVSGSAARAQATPQRGGEQPRQRRHRGRPRQPGPTNAAGGVPDRADGLGGRGTGVRVSTVQEDQTRPPRATQAPSADAEGYVTTATSARWRWST